MSAAEEQNYAPENVSKEAIEAAGRLLMTDARACLATFDQYLPGLSTGQLQKDGLYCPNQSAAQMFMLAANAAKRLGDNPTNYTLVQSVLDQSQIVNWPAQRYDALLNSAHTASARGDMTLVKRNLAEIDTISLDETEAAIEYHLLYRRSMFALKTHDITLHKILVKRLTHLRVHSLDASPLLESTSFNLRAGELTNAGQLREALQLHEKSINILQSLGDMYDVGRNLIKSSIIHHMLGQLHLTREKAARALKIFEEIGNQELQAAAQMMLGLNDQSEGKLRAARDRFENCRSLLDEEYSTVEYAVYLTNICDMEISLCEYQQALKTGLTALERWKHLEDAPGRTDVTLLHLGRIYMQMGDNQQALAYFLKSLERMQQHSLTSSLILLLGFIGRLYYRIGDLERSEEFYRRCLKENESLGNRELQRESILRLAAIAAAREDSTEAEQLYRHALNMGTDEFNPTQTAEILCGLAQVRQDAGDKDEALTFLGNAAEYQQQSEAQDGWIETQCKIATLLIERDPARAESILHKLLEDANSKKRIRRIPEIHKALAILFEAREQWREALEQERLFHDYSAHRFQETSTEQLNNLRAMHTVADEHQRAEGLKQHNQNLKDNLHAQEREIMGQALFISQKNAVIKHVRTRLQNSLQKNNDDLPDAVNKIVQTLNDVETDAGEWLQFDERFNRVHGNFQLTLSSRFPDLTPAELRVCALIKLHCSSKDISQIMNVEERSIETYRYRIRRKMQLDSRSNLASFIASID